MTRSRRLHPIKAYRAWKRLWANPDDTVAVFEIFEALRGRSEERVFHRFKATEMGRRILREERDLLATLRDRGALRGKREDSLGARYAVFMEQEQISADGLVEASKNEGIDDPEFQRFVCRWRDMHDLHHVVTGYGRDLHGEAALLAFTLGQTRTLSLWFIVGMAFLNGDTQDRRMIREGYRRGRAAAWFVNADWERLLDTPLDDVRAELRSGRPVEYTPLWSEGAPAAAS